MALTGNKDVDYLILDLLDDQELGNICQVNKKVNYLCEDEQFWRRRTYSRFGPYLTPLGINVADYNKGSWKEYYIKLKNVVDAAKESWETGGGDRNKDLIWDKGINVLWDSFKDSGSGIWVGLDMYKKKHPLGFRELKTDDEKALALQVALINSKRLYNEDFSQMPFDSPLFNFRDFYNVTDMNDILKRKNLVHLEKLRQIFDRVDPNKIIKSNNFFKKNRVPFLKILLEDSRLNKKSLLKAIAEYKVSEEAKPLLIEKLKELRATKDDFSKKVIKKLD